MIDYKYTKKEMLRNKILKSQDERLKSISFPNQMDDSIEQSEELIKLLGFEDRLKEIKQASYIKFQEDKISLKLPQWEELVQQAEQEIRYNVSLKSLFTNEELRRNEEYIQKMNNDFNQLHKLDSIDLSISVLAGIIAAALDILLIGIPQPTTEGLKAGSLSNYIRKYFEDKFPPEEMEKLGGKTKYKTPYDAQDNRNTTIHVEGLSAYYHRLLSLGHDPILGFLIGILDIMNNRMTTIDKSGKIVSQVMGCYTGRTESSLFEALLRQLRHLKSDLTTSMGLPAPLMGVFNLFQFGEIGEEKQTIAEIVQGMYYEGYDFIHFCSASIPVMVSEIIVRICYAFKRIKEGHSIKDSIPITLNRTQRPKLGTMLFISHSISTSINAGKVYFTKNPMSINYPQWLAFAKYSYQQLKWNLVNKPLLRDKYVHDKIDEEFKELYLSISNNYFKFT